MVTVKPLCRGAKRDCGRHVARKPKERKLSPKQQEAASRLHAVHLNEMRIHGNKSSRMRGQKQRSEVKREISDLKKQIKGSVVIE